MDSNQVPLEGPYTLTFRLYNAETAGTKVWEEMQTSVPLQGGHFSVLLGQVTSLTVDWSTPLWLSIQVGVEPELSPRQRITSVPLAVRAEVAESLVGGPTEISARVYNSASQSIANNTATLLTFDSERFDTDTIHDTASNTSRLTASTAGKYLVCAMLTFSTNGTGIRNVQLWKGSGWSIATEARGGLSFDSSSLTISTLANFGAGEWVEVRVSQDSGGSLSVSAQEFMMVKMP
ncbi:MAG: hypothetical protein HYZ89_04520 [Candidatus Omnitrophica bacterium]|nr:hypothetical protein [Candidatus Omnitrophota bacterium]